MIYFYTLTITIFIIITSLYIYSFIKNKKNEKKYKRLKNEISRIFNINLNNPSDDFVIHQIETNLKSIKNKFESEKNRRRNMYSILDTLNEGVMLTSLYQGDIIKVDFANKSSKEIFTLEDYIGRSLAEIVDSHNLIDLILKSFKRKINVEEEILFYSPEKRYYNCKIKTTEIDEKYRIVILTDVTKEKSLESLRKEFLTIMSHELRTPLAVMNGYLETILMNDNLEKDVEKMIKIIEDETARLTRLVNDLLDMGRLQKNISDEKEFKIINLSEVTGKAYKFFKMLADEMEINLEAEIEPDLFIMGNDDRILQVIYNLIDNAFKFTSAREEDKSIWIKLYKDAYENKNEIVLEVEDNGIGIPSKEIQKIFDMFYRVDKSRTRQISGFGLGLYIVKLILDNHDARIFLESEENNGTLFRINFKGGQFNETL
ncbi:HAMP domain-containing histidine kinase [Oceanotoga sp. DSM 15011]|uniref:histidine kinase n=1 Tax=Oceanotoga teriensis TaxID=515440 RepID=A0AA45HJU0_9BACT|nr:MULTISPECIES: ATP-binding protein [Oceanotoga]MDO7975386.1 HAMP domain-containing histidine kinase [Oceanotoga teriensis]PWJ96718.1 two-component system phosphate regulon sensor histidine kinase PhoR [Oceanotoga teriensis]UYP00110.1 HAMP domain-containing histidine kinase [Oceanotoga sp. DSM 15011]